MNESHERKTLTMFKFQWTIFFCQANCWKFKIEFVQETVFIFRSDVFVVLKLNVWQCRAIQWCYVMLISSTLGFKVFIIHSLYLLIIKFLLSFLFSNVAHSNEFLGGWNHKNGLQVAIINYFSSQHLRSEEKKNKKCNRYERLFGNFWEYYEDRQKKTNEPKRKIIEWTKKSNRWNLKNFSF